MRATPAVSENYKKDRAAPLLVITPRREEGQNFPIDMKFDMFLIWHGSSCKSISIVADCCAGCDETQRTHRILGSSQLDSFKLLTTG
ncbi:hypothetical protein EG68_12372 [Paragonimus skrjabini miyazakii]|uniref:Uncharacterized protein n=1 Tax=Paragonimus skrjabini miyazakii TaxID=59628 RepID=A0A8S9YFI6_9TREM|nr:hypothetical protein EG68_12372 [Paragonimus skrjabini miyazakii]